MVAVTLVSVLCSLVAWLGPVMRIVPILAVGPISGTMIARIRKSDDDWDVILGSGIVTMVLLGSLCVGVWVVEVSSSAPEDMLFLAIFSAVFAGVSYGFFGVFIGMLTGLVWQVVAGVAKGAWRRIVRLHANS